MARAPPAIGPVAPSHNPKARCPVISLRGYSPHRNIVVQNPIRFERFGHGALTAL
jgi:hypothetical protein